ncbi:MAG: LptE family protein [Bacteroidales bacterium]|nr:LptE family protein [Bacteroidales bacterium]
MRVKQLLILLVSVLAWQSCKIGYSFTGASLSPDVKTVSVDYFDNRSSLVNPGLSQNFTESLKDKFTSDAGLSLVSSGGDLEFKGYISAYSLTPVSIQQNEAAMMRLTISVQVEFKNNIDDKQSYSQTFSDFEDYNADSDFTSVEEELNRAILEKLMEKIFLKSAANW